jgi:hypothetical protein
VAVGYLTGDIILYDIEHGAKMHSIKSTDASITSLAWVEDATAQNEDLEKVYFSPVLNDSLHSLTLLAVAVLCADRQGGCPTPSTFLASCPGLKEVRFVSVLDL